jgi:hypothetical protein
MMWEPVGLGIALLVLAWFAGRRAAATERAVAKEWRDRVDTHVQSIERLAIRFAGDHSSNSEVTLANSGTLPVVIAPEKPPEAVNLAPNVSSQPTPHFRGPLTDCQNGLLRGGLRRYSMAEPPHEQERRQREALVSHALSQAGLVYEVVNSTVPSVSHEWRIGFNRNAGVVVTVTMFVQPDYLFAYSYPFPTAPQSTADHLQRMLRTNLGLALVKTCLDDSKAPEVWGQIPTDAITDLNVRNLIQAMLNGIDSLLSIFAKPNPFLPAT